MKTRNKKDGTEITLKFSSKVADVSNADIDFPHKLLLINTQVQRLHKAFASNSPANTKLSKPQLSKIRELGGILMDFEEHK